MTFIIMIIIIIDTHQFKVPICIYHAYYNYTLHDIIMDLEPSHLHLCNIDVTWHVT